MKFDTLTLDQFRSLPFVVEGESKEVRYWGEGKVVIRLKPTIYSFTANRCGVVEGSDKLRLKAARLFMGMMKDSDIPYAYHEVSDNFILADLILQPGSSSDVFRPEDVSVSSLKIAPPIEVIVKRMHSGTSKHRYEGMSGFPIRRSHPLYPRYCFRDDDAYPCAIVRFDWRNPLESRKGERLADDVLGEEQADWYIDVKTARNTALKVYDALSYFLSQKDLVCYDLCLFITEDGETVFGEISQDCGRFRHFDLGSLDKDVWRSGGSSNDVLEKWQLLVDVLEGKR